MQVHRVLLLGSWLNFPFVLVFYSHLQTALVHKVPSVHMWQATKIINLFVITDETKIISSWFLMCSEQMKMFPMNGNVKSKN